MLALRPLFCGVACVALASIALPSLSSAQQVRTLRPSATELDVEFSSIDGIRELRDGRVLIVVARDRVVQLADFVSNTVEQVGRTGSGPGEYRAPIGVFGAPGDSSIVFDGGQSRLLFVDPEGRLGQSQVVTGVGASSGMISRFVPRQGDARGHLFATESAIRITAQGESLADSVPINRWERHGTAVRPVGYVRVRSLEDRGGALGGPSAIPFVVGDQWAVALDGRVAIVRWDTYRVELVDPNGRRTTGPPVAVEPIRVTPAIRAEWRAQQPSTVPEPARWPEYLPPFPPLPARFAPSGALWVRRHVPAGALPLYDVFDEAARRVYQVRLDAPGEVVGFGRNHVFIARTDEDGLRYLRRAEIP